MFGFDEKFNSRFGILLADSSAAVASTAAPPAG